VLESDANADLRRAARWPDQPRQLASPDVGSGCRGRWHTPAARVFDLRSTFASDALAAGVSIHALARMMGTSVRMIERH
jgi:hypothetical protein